MRTLILLATLASLSAEGGEVYKCKGLKGEITYTNIKCPEHTAPEHYATYQPEEEPPPPALPAPNPPAPPALPPPATPTAAETMPLSSATSASSTPFPPPVVQPVTPPLPPQTPLPIAQPSPSLDPPAAPASGYKCSDGVNAWLQSTPCATAMAHATPTPASTAPVEATPPNVVASKQATPDAETSPSQGPLCDQLISQAGDAGHRQGGTGTDELNKLLAANGCRR